MSDFKLKMVAVYTKNSRIVGKVDGNVINSMKNGIIFRGENIKVAPKAMFLNFFSPPYGKGVYKRNFRSTAPVVNPLGIYYEYGAVSKDQISFFHDLSGKKSENISFEKKMIENIHKQFAAMQSEQKVKFDEAIEETGVKLDNYLSILSDLQQNQQLQQRVEQMIIEDEAANAVSAP